MEAVAIIQPAAVRLNLVIFMMQIMFIENSRTGYLCALLLFHYDYTFLVVYILVISEGLARRSYIRNYVEQHVHQQRHGGHVNSSFQQR